MEVAGQTVVRPYEGKRPGDRLGRAGAGGGSGARGGEVPVRLRSGQASAALGMTGRRGGGCAACAGCKPALLRTATADRLGTCRTKRGGRRGQEAAALAFGRPSRQLLLPYGERKRPGRTEGETAAAAGRVATGMSLLRNGGGPGRRQRPWRSEGRAANCSCPTRKRKEEGGDCG